MDSRLQFQRKPKSLTAYQPRFCDPAIQAFPQSRQLRPQGPRIGYGPPDQVALTTAHDGTSFFHHPSQLGPNGRSLFRAGCRRLVFLEVKPGKMLKRAVASVGIGGTLVIVDAIHATGCSVSRLRNIKRRVEKRGATLTILRVGARPFLDWDQCEAMIRRACTERAKKNGCYKAGRGRPTKVDPMVVKRLKDSGLSDEEVAHRLDCDRSTVFRAIKKAKTLDSAAARIRSRRGPDT
jgi:hypothetical protein